MKYVYLWEFNYDLVAPNFNDMYGQINYEAEEILKSGWNPSYLYGEGAEKGIVNLVSKFAVDSFDEINSVKFIYGVSDECYFEIIDDKIYEKGGGSSRKLHFLIKKHILKK